MPFALVFIGLVLVVTGARGTMSALGAELREDFTGEGNFIWWIVSIGVVGALGYIPELKSFSRWFMTLIVLSMILSNRGFFAKLTQALQAGPTTPERNSGIEADAFLNNFPLKEGMFGGISKGAGEGFGSALQGIVAQTNANDNTTAPNVGTGFSAGVGDATGNLFTQLFRKAGFAQY